MGERTSKSQKGTTTTTTISGAKTSGKQASSKKALSSVNKGKEGNIGNVPKAKVAKKKNPKESLPKSLKEYNGEHIILGILHKEKSVFELLSEKKLDLYSCWEFSHMLRSVYSDWSIKKRKEGELGCSMAQPPEFSTYFEFICGDRLEDLIIEVLTVSKIIYSDEGYYSIKRSCENFREVCEIMKAYYSSLPIFSHLKETQA